MKELDEFLKLFIDESFFRLGDLVGEDILRLEERELVKHCLEECLLLITNGYFHYKY